MKDLFCKALLLILAKLSGVFLTDSKEAIRNAEMQYPCASMPGMNSRFVAVQVEDFLPGRPRRLLPEFWWLLGVHYWWPSSGGAHFSALWPSLDVSKCPNGSCNAAWSCVKILGRTPLSQQVAFVIRAQDPAIRCMQIKQSDPGAQKLLYGAFGLPFGLALIIICGGELYTGNAAFLPAAVFEVIQLSTLWPLNMQQVLLTGEILGTLIPICKQHAAVHVSLPLSAILQLGSCVLLTWRRVTDSAIWVLHRAGPHGCSCSRIGEQKYFLHEALTVPFCSTYPESHEPCNSMPCCPCFCFLRSD